MSSQVRLVIFWTWTTLLLLTRYISANPAILKDGTTTAKPQSYGRCQPIEVPMCKGLIKYDKTRLPNKFGHRTQSEVYWALQPWWPFIDAGCSNNLRTFLCSLYLPQCISQTKEARYPCHETCKKAKVRCAKQMRKEGMRWIPEFRCQRLLPKSSKRCVTPVRETKKKKNKEYVLCEVNTLSMCQGLPFSQGSLPNMFLQADMKMIEREMRQFQPLLDGGCSKKLQFFLCGVYMPFCVLGSHEDEGVMYDSRTAIIGNGRPDVPFVVPCKELCQEVYDECSGEYAQRTNGLPWPGKFHCHRFPSYVDRYDSATGNTNNSVVKETKRKGYSVPCTMPPYSFDGN